MRYIEYFPQKVSWRPVRLPYSGTYLCGQVGGWIIEFQIIEVPLYNQWDFAVHPTVGSCSLLFCRLLREKPNCSMIAIESMMRNKTAHWLQSKSNDEKKGPI